MLGTVVCAPLLELIPFFFSLLFLFFSILFFTFFYIRAANLYSLHRSVQPQRRRVDSPEISSEIQVDINVGGELTNREQLCRNTSVQLSSAFSKRESVSLMHAHSS